MYSFLNFKTRTIADILVFHNLPILNADFNHDNYLISNGLIDFERYWFVVETDDTRGFIVIHEYRVFIVT